MEMTGNVKKHIAFCLECSNQVEREGKRDKCKEIKIERHVWRFVTQSFYFKVRTKRKPILM